MVGSILEVDRELQQFGYRIYVTEGYRSKELYELVNKKMIERLGEKEKDKILNMKDMPHASGRSVDVALWKDGEVKRLHDKTDGIKGYFVGFYKGKNDEYQKLQDLLIGIMQNHGFKLGTKGEYFHFNYDPD